MRLNNIYQLGIKQLWSLMRDPIMIVLIVFALTVLVYSEATSSPETLSRAPIAIVDEGQPQLAERISCAFQPPYFMPPQIITPAEMDRRMDTNPSTPACPQAACCRARCARQS